MANPTSSAPEPVGVGAPVTRFDPCVEIERTDSGGELRYPDMQPATLGDYVCYDDYCALATAHAAQAAELEREQGVREDAQRQLREAEQRAARCEQERNRAEKKVDWLVNWLGDLRRLVARSPMSAAGRATAETVHVDSGEVVILLDDDITVGRFTKKADGEVFAACFNFVMDALAEPLPTTDFLNTICWESWRNRALNAEIEVAEDRARLDWLSGERTVYLSIGGEWCAQDGAEIWAAATPREAIDAALAATTEKNPDEVPNGQG